MNMKRDVAESCDVENLPHDREGRVKFVQNMHELPRRVGDGGLVCCQYSAGPNILIGYGFVSWHSECYRAHRMLKRET